MNGLTGTLLNPCIDQPVCVASVPVRITCAARKWERELEKTVDFFVDVYSCFNKGCPTKAYATMPIGIMGRTSLAFIH